MARSGARWPRSSRGRRGGYRWSSCHVGELGAKWRLAASRLARLSRPCVPKQIHAARGDDPCPARQLRRAWKFPKHGPAQAFDRFARSRPFRRRRAAAGPIEQKYVDRVLHRILARSGDHREIELLEADVCSSRRRSRIDRTSLAIGEGERTRRRTDPAAAARGSRRIDLGEEGILRDVAETGEQQGRASTAIAAPDWRKRPAGSAKNITPWRETSKSGAEPSPWLPFRGIRENELDIAELAAALAGGGDQLRGDVDARDAIRRAARARWRATVRLRRSRYRERRGKLNSRVRCEQAFGQRAEAAIGSPPFGGPGLAAAALATRSCRSIASSHVALQTIVLSGARSNRANAKKPARWFE